MKPVTVDIATLDELGNRRTANSFAVPNYATALERVQSILSKRRASKIVYNETTETWTMTDPQGGIEVLRIIR